MSKADKEFRLLRILRDLGVKRFDEASRERIAVDSVS